MKAYTYYDADGKIHGIIVGNAPEGLHVMLSPQPGLYVGELEGLNVKDARDFEALRKVAESYRIAEPGTRVKLKKNA